LRLLQEREADFEVRLLLRLLWTMVFALGRYPERLRKTEMLIKCELSL
jgi:hypothetical protein